MHAACGYNFGTHAQWGLSTAIKRKERRRYWGLPATHAEARAALMQAIDSALAACGLTRDHDVTTRTRLICLLLGSPPPHTHERLFGHPTAYRDILRATARFIKSVHATRWLQHA